MSTSPDRFRSNLISDNSPVPAWHVSEQRSLRGFAVEWAEPGRLLLSRGNRLYHAAEIGDAPSLVGSCPAGALTLAARLRLSQRALRLMFYNVLPLPSGEVFVTFGKVIGVLSGRKFKALSGRDRACRVLRGACALDPSGTVYFGEYLRNPERTPIRIYRYEPGSDAAEIVHTFDAGSVRHVHGVYHDATDGSLWVLTGDLEHECKILRTADAFASLEVIGQGDETWRAVSALFTEDAVYYGMDAEFRQNHVFRLDKRTGQRELLGDVDGPIYYSNSVGDHQFFGVTAELCPSQVGRSATLWHVGPADRLQRVMSHEKDRFSRHFMPGTLHFPRGPGLADQLMYHGVGLAGADNRTYSVKVRSQATQRAA